MSDKIVVDERLAAPVVSFNVQHLIVDPLWQGGIIEVGGSQVAVLAITLPVPAHGQVFIAPSLEALEQFETWARATREHLLARLPPVSVPVAAMDKNPSNYDGVSPNQAEISKIEAEIGQNPQKPGNGAG